jgi:hypothetical protein
LSNRSGRGAQGGKHFRASYVELWGRVVRECQAQEALADDYLLDHIQSFLTSLSWCAPEPESHQPLDVLSEFLCTQAAHQRCTVGVM